MANLNIKEEFWIDVIDVAARTGDQDLAIGNSVRWFRYAQSKHKEGKVVTEEEFKMKRFSEALFPNFAERVDGGIRAVGSKKFFDWLMDKSDSGVAGGKKSAERPRDGKGRLLSKEAIEAKKIQEESKQTQADSSDSNEKNLLGENVQASKHSQAIPISISIPITNNTSSSKKATGCFGSRGELGAISAFAGSPLLSAILKNVAQGIQRAWVAHWPGKEHIICKSLEKAYAFYSSKGLPENINWGFILTKWLWNERDLKERALKPGQVFEDNFSAFENLLKANNVFEISDLVNMLKEGA